jgi:hypothetical protein
VAAIFPVGHYCYVVLTQLVKMWLLRRSWL